MAEFRSGKRVTDPTDEAVDEYYELDELYDADYLRDLQYRPKAVATYFEHKAAELSGQVGMDLEG